MAGIVIHAIVIGVFVIYAICFVGWVLGVNDDG